MDDNREIGVSLATYLLVISVIVMIIMGIFLYKFYNEKTEANKEISRLQNQVSDLERTVNNLQSKLDRISGNEHSIVNNTSDINYTINTRNERYATIQAIDDENTVSEEFELKYKIDKTGSMNIPNIGDVALVSYTTGKSRVVNIYQLVNGKIQFLGDIDCGANMVKEADYSISVKENDIAVITAKRYDETVTNEFQMNASIDNTNVIDIFDYGKIVVIAESDGGYYGIQMFRLSQDYVTKDTQQIISVCYIKYNA